MMSHMPRLCRRHKLKVTFTHSVKIRRNPRHLLFPTAKGIEGNCGDIPVVVDTYLCMYKKYLI